VSELSASAGFLLDTSVISALAPDRQAHMPGDFADWLHVHTMQLFIPCIAVAELAQGVSKLRRAGSAGRADRLELWLDGLIASYGDRILPLDAAAAKLAGSMSDDAVARGCHPGLADVMIAALARQSGCLLLTRNLRHFQTLNVPCMDPIVQLPA